MVLGYWDIRGVSDSSPAQLLGQRCRRCRWVAASAEGASAELPPRPTSGQPCGVPRPVGREGDGTFRGQSEGAA